jgi:hypothetical protein
VIENYGEDVLGSPNSISSIQEYQNDNGPIHMNQKWGQNENSPSDQQQLSFGKAEAHSDESGESGERQILQGSYSRQIIRQPTHMHSEGQFILTLDTKPDGDQNDNDTITVTIPPTNDMRNSPSHIPYTIGKCN